VLAFVTDHGEALSKKSRSLLQKSVVKPLRVIHLGKYYPPASGGIENHTRTLAQGLAKRGVAVEAVVVNHATKTAQDVTFERFRLTPDALDHDGDVTVHRVGRVGCVAKLDLSPNLPKLLTHLQSQSPDLWHMHTPNITMMLAVLANRHIRPLIITHHSDIIRQRVLRHAVRPLENALYKRAARLLATSPGYSGGSSILQSFLPKVEALPLGIDLDPFVHPSAAALHHATLLRQKHTGPIWLSVGRLIYYKGLDTALEALKTVPGTLIVIGTGPMEAAWKAKAVELGVADRVVWQGRSSQDELVGTFLAATAHWFPSNARSEGFGLVQVEAMATGCPTINTAIPHSGVSWVCRHDHAGLTVQPNDAVAFAAAANQLVADPKLRQRLSDQGRIDANVRFSSDVMAEQCLAIYQDVVSKHGKRKRS